MRVTKTYPTCGQEVVDPLLRVVQRHVEPRRDDAALVDASGQLMTRTTKGDEKRIGDDTLFKIETSKQTGVGGLGRQTTIITITRWKYQVSNEKELTSIPIFWTAFQRKPLFGDKKIRENQGGLRYKFVEKTRPAVQSRKSDERFA